VSIKGKAYIVGAYEHPTRKAPDKSLAQLHAEVALGALADAGLGKEDVDGYFCAGDAPGMGPLSMVDYLNLRVRHVDSTDTGGSSYLIHVAHAAEAIALGKCRVALITLAGRPRSEGMATGTAPRAGNPTIPEIQFEYPYAPTVANMYAMCAMRHMYQFGTTSEQLAWIKVAASHHAQHNPHALLREDLTRGAYARYVVELLDRFFAQDEGGPALFDLLDHTLTWLCQERDLDLVARFYEQCLLGLAGFRPELFRCVGEHNTIVLLPRESPTEQRPYGLDPERGGALCPECYEACKAVRAVVPLSPAVLRFLQECQRGPYTRLRGQQFAPTLHTEAERVMQHYVTYHLERGVRSGAFLRELKRG